MFTGCPPRPPHIQGAQTIDQMELKARKLYKLGTPKQTVRKMMTHDGYTCQERADFSFTTNPGTPDAENHSIPKALVCHQPAVHGDENKTWVIVFVLDEQGKVSRILANETLKN